MTGPDDVEAYLAALPEAQRAELEELRAAIRVAAPDATEGISYQMPAFKDGDRALVAYGAFKEHCSLFVMSTKVLDDHQDALEPYRAGKGTIRFLYGSPLPSALVQKLVQARLEENAARRRR